MSKNKNIESVADRDKAVKRETVIKLVALILITAVIFAVYRISIEYPIIVFLMPAYYIVLTVLIVVYIIYNRGFARKNMTVDMLPDEWSDDEKTEFIEDGKRRIKRSSWMLMLIMGFGFTLFFDLLELIVLPWLENLLR